MLTWLTELSGYFSPLNLFRYLTFRTIGATAHGGAVRVLLRARASSRRCASSRARASRSAPTARTT